MDKHKDRGITQMKNKKKEELPRWKNIDVQEIPSG
jgi:hypothetical protein